MQVYLWKSSEFTKKTNSTKQPTLASGTLVEGYLRNPDVTQGYIRRRNIVSMYNPQVRFDISQFQSPTLAPSFNYAFIPDFGNRYYWITDWLFEEGVWEAVLTIDVLATYKSAIGNTDQYILRAANEWDGTIIDTHYPAKTTISEQASLTNVYRIATNQIEIHDLSNLYNCNFQDGSIVFGLYGPNFSNYVNTGVTWWITTVSEFSKVAQKLMDFDLTSSGLWSTATVDLPQDYAKAIADPIQFFAGIYWFPFNQGHITQETPITHIGPNKFGYYSIDDLDFKAIQILPKRDNPRITGILSISPHPQATSRGKFLNCAPYSKYHLFIPPFGEFDLDSALLRDTDNIIITMYIDLTSGNARMDARTGTGLKYLGTFNGQVGVPVTLTQLTYDPRGVIQGATKTIEGGVQLLSGVASSVMGAYEGVKNSPQGILSEFKGGMSGMANGLTNIYKGAKKTASGIADAIEAAQHSVTNTGSNGSFLDWTCNRWPTVYSVHYIVVDDDITNLGRPLMSIRKPANLGGFMLCDGTHTITIGTAEETQTVNAFLQGGFYYE